MKRSLTLVATLSAYALLCGTAAGGAFTFTTGAPDGRAGFASRPANGAFVEIETADDFIIGSPTSITGATFTGLIPAGVPLSSITFAGVELYRVFPNDSGPFDNMVPTRVNSPSDNAFASRDSTGGGGLTFTTTLVNGNFTAGNSIVNGINKSLTPFTGGEGPVTGQEVQINVTFTTPFLLSPTAADQGHFFFKPEAGLTTGTFLWLSTPRSGPIFVGDLQAWIRNTNLDPDWLRAGTDIIGGGNPAPTFNAAFSLQGVTVPEPSTLTLLFGGFVVLAWTRRRLSL